MPDTNSPVRRCYHIAAMRVRDFLILAQQELVRALSPDLRDFRWRTAFSYLQVYYWYPAVHYELWPQRKTGRVEIGLHFEGEREHNHRWLFLLGEHMIELQSSIAAPLEIEEWTQTWSRLHYTLPYESLSEDAAALYANHLARLIEAAQPLLARLRNEHNIAESRLTRPQRMRARTMPRSGYP